MVVVFDKGTLSLPCSSYLIMMECFHALIRKADSLDGLLQ
jgi:hypothetical protein